MCLKTVALLHGKSFPLWSHHGTKMRVIHGYYTHTSACCNSILLGCKLEKKEVKFVVDLSALSCHSSFIQIRHFVGIQMMTDGTVSIRSARNVLPVTRAYKYSTMYPLGRIHLLYNIIFYYFLLHSILFHFMFLLAALGVVLVIDSDYLHHAG